MTLWVEHPDKSKREYNDSERFMVCTNPMNYGTDGYKDLYNGDDVTLALAALEKGDS